MTAEPSPRVLAYAIAELGGEQIRAAVQYLDGWAAGIRYGVPPADLRRALDETLVATEARRVLSQWYREGERGMLCLVGDCGLGKTMSAVLWLLARAREGKATTWWLASEWPYDFDDRDRALARIGSARALVIDDLGDGVSAIASMAEEERSKITAKLSARIGSGLPTVILSNATKAEVKQWLGGRLIDRLSYGGGVYELAPGPSLRKPDLVEVDGEGRSPRWHAAQRLVGLVGVERDGDELRFGRLLELSPERCAEAMRLLGLDRAEVVSRASEILDGEREVIEAVAAETGIELPIRELTWAELAPHVHHHIATGAERQAEAEARRRADLEARRRAISDAIEDEGLVDIDPPPNPPSAALSSTQALARHYGIRVFIDDADGYEVMIGDTVIACGPWSKAQAWWVVAEILRPHLAPRLAAVGGDS